MPIKTNRAYLRKNLKRYFGYDQFRFGQEKVVKSVLQGRDTFVLMPTGGGKSLCFQLPALMMEGTAIVVSPLIALMKDQVYSLKSKNIRAEFINSTVPSDQRQKIIEDLKSGQLDFLYLSPERLFWDGSCFLDLLKQVKISLFVIDEAHCISRWGHNFRPDYLKLSKLRDNFKDVPVVALTATADQDTRGEIVQNLRLSNPQIFVSGFDRPNIYYHIQWSADNDQINRILLHYLKNHPDDPGVIYVFSRLRADQLTNMLTREGLLSRSYHAGLPREVRDRHQREFMENKVKRIVATTAFGMGVDKPNIRFVFHTSLPLSIEDYYQETGRAGRDGGQTTAILCWHQNQVKAMGRLMAANDKKQAEKMKTSRSQDNWQNEPIFWGNQPWSKETIGQTSEILEKQASDTTKFIEMYKLAASSKCRRQSLLRYFGEAVPGYCGHCDSCLRRANSLYYRIVSRLFSDPESSRALSPALSGGTR